MRGTGWQGMFVELWVTTAHRLLHRYPQFDYVPCRLVEGSGQAYKSPGFILELKFQRPRRGFVFGGKNQKKSGSFWQEIKRHLELSSAAI